MIDNQVQQLSKYRDDFLAFRAALNTESDRGCALYAAAYLDKALGELLAACMVQGPKLKEDLFVSQRALGNFSSRIALAYYLGKIAPSERSDLDTIRGIRNDFAHNSTTLDFGYQSIRDRCGNLAHIWQANDAHSRAKFISAVCGLLSRIYVMTVKAVAVTELEESPIPEDMKVHIRRLSKAAAEAMLAGDSGSDAKS